MRLRRALTEWKRGFSWEGVEARQRRASTTTPKPSPGQGVGKPSRMALRERRNPDAQTLTRAAFRCRVFGGCRPDALLVLTPLPPSPWAGEGGMWLTLRYTGSADVPQRQILTPWQEKGQGGGVCGTQGLHPPETLHLRAHPLPRAGYGETRFPHTPTAVGVAWHTYRQGYEETGHFTRIQAIPGGTPAHPGLCLTPFLCQTRPGGPGTRLPGT